mmetsp:Transcript_35558/g.107431  ORF Transcript_35558/g.107431 Transcript_35558/m.107431 type:complete len:271 (+) Transcript_35558:242-1054(+)
MIERVRVVQVHAFGVLVVGIADLERLEGVPRRLVRILLLFLLLRQGVELRVVRCVLLDELVLVLLVANSAGLLGPRDQILVARLFVEALLEHFQRLVVVLHLQRGAARAEVPLGPRPIGLDRLRRLDQGLRVLAQLEIARRPVAVDLVLLGHIPNQGTSIVLQGLLVLLFLEGDVAHVFGLERCELDHLGREFGSLRLFHQLLDFALLAELRDAFHLVVDRLIVLLRTLVAAAALLLRRRHARNESRGTLRSGTGGAAGRRRRGLPRAWA